MSKRPPKSPPMTRIELRTASVDDTLASLQFSQHYREAKAAVDTLRWRSEGDDAEMLARLFAYNLARHTMTLKGKAKGIATRQANAEARHKEIRKRLAEPGASLRSVAGELEMLGLPSRSLRTIVRAKNKGQK